MDEIKSQSSVCTDENSTGNDLTTNLDRRICLVGKLVHDTSLRTVAESFGYPVITSQTGQEYVHDDSCTTIFVLENFEGDVYTSLYKLKQPLLGPPALQELANKKRDLPKNTRPLYNLSMTGVVVCFTGFRNKEELIKLVPLIHHMGGSIRKEVCVKVTHLIANTAGGGKYQYASTFRVPVMNYEWVFASWERRHDSSFVATLDLFMAEYKLKPFHGIKVCFVGFPQEEEKHMTEVLLSNGGTVTNLEDPNCSYVVMDQSEACVLEAAPLSPTDPNTPSKNTPSSIFLTKQNNNTYLKGNQTVACLETLHENSQNDLINDMSNICFDQSFDLSRRKRKFPSPDQSNVILAKRKRDKCNSEKRKKVSEFFKTPINYFSNRRRTIDAATFEQSLNESIISSSGVFNVEAVQNLSCITDVGTTPTNSIKKLNKKNLFTRTFSSSKFTRSKAKKKVDLNATKLSFGEPSGIDGFEKLNTSCFPDIFPNPRISHSELSSELARAARRTSVAVVDESAITEKPDVGIRVHVVKAEWFWTSVQKETCLEEKEYLFDDYVDQGLSPIARRDSHAATPSSGARRKRKRMHEAISAFVHQSPSLHKRRSSVSDAGLLSVSGSFLDCTTSPDKAILDGGEPVPETPRKGLTPRHQVFLELLQTESNYVDILHTIVNMFKKHLEEMPEEEALLNNTELNLIFGKLPLIYETHVKMLEALRKMNSNWSEEHSIGQIIVDYSKDLSKAYPPYINYFEEVKDQLIRYDQTKPRFHAFLKACQTKPECGRQNLQDLMIRPVQRLGSISLLLNDILKNTAKSNPDHSKLELALNEIRNVLQQINEDKRKTEGQVILFNIFNEIDNCPPDIVSSHRSLITKAEVVQVSSEGLSSKGNNLMLFLFSDQLEVCKKKSKAFNSLKSPSSINNLQTRPVVKSYKHVKLIPLSTIKKVIDIKETEDCQRVFSLICRNLDEGKDRLYTFAMVDEDADKSSFIKLFTKQMATHSCTADSDKFLGFLEPHQLDIDTTDLLGNGTLSKAFKFATRTKLKVGRAFSFNKTPSKLKRAVSSMMSPFGSSTNLTPASQLAQMRLASCNNLSELGAVENAQESPPVAPMSVQPTRKMKASSLGVNALKRL